MIKEVEDIFNNYDRSEWISIIKNLNYEEDEYNHIIITFENGDQDIIYSSFEELSMTRFPFEIGDIVKHNQFGGEFVIYDYPILDERKDLSYFKKYKCYGLYVANDRLFYKVDGYIDNKPYGFELVRDIYGNKAIPLYEHDCYWRNWSKIGNIFEDENYDKRLKEILLYYWKDCPKDYQPLYDNIQKLLREG